MAKLRVPGSQVAQGRVMVVTGGGMFLSAVLLLVSHFATIL